MSILFEELDYCPTPKGALSLRRRTDPASGKLVYEIKLDEEFLMSSLFTEAEEQLAHMGLAELLGDNLDVVVGGLGLGCTAAAALEHDGVGALLVVDALGEVIEWHRKGLLPLGETLCNDGRCRLVQGDFFTMAADPATGFDPDAPGRRFDAILLDVDHSPRNLLHPDHAPFYQAEGLAVLSAHLQDGGVFALWSTEPPDAPFMALLRGVFTDVQAKVVTFKHPNLDREDTNTIYLAKKAPS